MESTPKASPRPKTSQEDVDLGQLFYKTGGVLNNMVFVFNRAMTKLYYGFLNLLFFFRRNFVWLLIGTLVGGGYGLYLVSKFGARYTSELTVRANFNSTRSLYGSIDYFNSLIGNTKTEELSRMLRITPAEAASLKHMEAVPVKSELIMAEMYQEEFLKNSSHAKLRMDTFWVRALDYKDFKLALTKYDYPLHRISVTSTNESIFPKIQQGIINKISSNDLLQQIKNTGTETNKEVVHILSSSIQSLDTLRSTYNKRLATTSASAESKGNSVMLLEGNVNSRFPELELYDKLLELKDELKNAKSQYVLENDIIQVFSSFTSVGQKESFFKQSIVKYGLIGFIATLVIVAAISFYIFLLKLEQAQNTKKHSKALHE